MKVSTRGKVNVIISQKEIEAQIDMLNSPLEYNHHIFNNTEKGENSDTNENDINQKENGINDIDKNHNTIIINKQKLKEINNVKKENKSEKKYQCRKGEIINLLINEKINNSNYDTNNLIKSSYGHLENNTNFLENFEIFGKISYNSEFPEKLTEKFLERKRFREGDLNSFGENPLTKLKNVQNLMLEHQTKNNKSLPKNNKDSKKNLKEQNIHLQKYIKSIPVIDCFDTELFQFNHYYTFNKINDEKNVNHNNGINNKENKSNKTKSEASEENNIQNIDQNISNPVLPHLQ